MYLRRIKVTNTGPLEKLDIECRFDDRGRPFPVVLVGRNGSGKSIAIAYVVNALISAHSSIFDDSDVQRGKVYKIRSPAYITSGAAYSMGIVQFDNEYSVAEIQLSGRKDSFKQPVEEYLHWNQIKSHQTSHFYSTFNQFRDQLRESLSSDTHLYFPANRYEEPAWLNEVNLTNRSEYFSRVNTAGTSERPIVAHSPLRKIQNWLLDLIYDAYAIERVVIVGGDGRSTPIAVGEGTATKLLSIVEDVVRTVVGAGDGPFRWSVGGRTRRTIGITVGGRIITNNIFSLSSGQTAALDLFLAILMDYDLSHSQAKSSEDIRGVVIVDEVDLHLHVDLQQGLLPTLISKFPNVQFILSTHSPFFLLGLAKVIGEDRVQVLDLPSGTEISVEQFAEFEIVYGQIKDSLRFQHDVRELSRSVQKPVLFVEGVTDIDYIKRAATVLGKEGLLDKFRIYDAQGRPNLDKVWQAYKSHLHQYLEESWILLYDCDTQIKEDSVGRLFKKVIPKQVSPVEKGIENLFRNETLSRARAHKPAFIDVTESFQKITRGVKEIVPEIWEVNRDEKRNLCDWVCQNSSASDFSNFQVIFDILQSIEDCGTSSISTHLEQ